MVQSIAHPAQDIKPNNDPAVLFPLLHKLIVAHESWETLLAPRLVLGLWHPRFIPFAREILPGCRRSYLGISVSDARTYFWDNVDTISLLFASIISNGGRTFVEQMHAAGKRVMVWTVNDPEMMLEVTSSGCLIVYRQLNDTSRRSLGSRMLS